MYEVEIRFVVEEAAEAFELLPFFQRSLGSPKSWTTDIIGKQLFEAGKLLRMGAVEDEKRRHFLGYKAEDVGKIANVRQEWGEEITSGIRGGRILPQIGIFEDFASASDVRAALNEEGYSAFMTFSGEDRLGYEEDLRLHTKLCSCSAILGDKLLIELEMEAATLAEAREAEKLLLALASDYHIFERLVRDEPPTMLYRIYQAKGWI